MVEKPEPSRPFKVFYSYSHKDKKLRKELGAHLKALEHENLIRSWHDRMIAPGDEWASEIDKHLDEADIILLLVSSDFISSEYCWGAEMARAIERYNAGEARIIPVIIRKCVWQGTAFGKLQALPDTGLAVDDSKRERRDLRFTNVVEGIKAVIQKKTGDSEARSTEKRSLGIIKPKIPDLLPYLCDRVKEEEDLRTAILQIKDEMRQRPLICIIHGDQDECHNMFRKQLQKNSLLRFLKDLNPDELPIHDFQLRIPSDYKGTKDYLDKIRCNLAEQVLGRSTASNQDIARTLSLHKAPVMICSDLRTEDWQPHGPQLIKTFIEYWDEFPDVRPGPHLISCLFFTYRSTRVTDVSQAERHIEVNHQARSFLESLDFSEYRSEYRKVCGVVLPELRAVKLKDVEDWICDRKYFDDFCTFHRPEFCNIQDALREIRTLFSQSTLMTSENRIPMELLATKLKEVLKRNRC
jgi:hypothetical protein